MEIKQGDFIRMINNGAVRRKFLVLETEAIEDVFNAALYLVEETGTGEAIKKDDSGLSPLFWHPINRHSTVYWEVQRGETWERID